MWRAHPIIFAALMGATTGLVNVAVLMLAVGQFEVMTNRILILLWPTSILAFGLLDGGSRTFAIFLIAAEFGGNALIYAFVFAAPVCLILAVRRSFGVPEQPPSIARPD